MLYLIAVDVGVVVVVDVRGAHVEALVPIVSVHKRNPEMGVVVEINLLISGTTFHEMNKLACPRILFFAIYYYLEGRVGPGLGAVLGVVVGELQDLGRALAAEGLLFAVVVVVNGQDLDILGLVVVHGHDLDIPAV